MVQRLGLHAFTAEGVGSIPGRGTKIPQAIGYGQKKNPKIKSRYNLHTIRFTLFSEQFYEF